MLFNTLQFALFFMTVYSLYLASNHKWQNRLLLGASYFFYGSWDYRFLVLLLTSTTIDYFCGLNIFNSTSQKRRRLFLIVSILGNLSILGFFKYFNFFSENFQTFLLNIGFRIDPVYLNIILPVGISFYTFQAMSYTIDIYRGQMEPTRKFYDFALFVAFFPQLVAGPIERAKNLLPQIQKPRKLTLSRFYEGCYLIFWGLFQKVFIADNLASIVDPVFSNHHGVNGVVGLLAVYAFAFQIFCDFAGYSNIARGLAKCMGFEIMINFRLPYFAKNPGEFWANWHISLSTWLRDYLFLPISYWASRRFAKDRFFGVNSTTWSYMTGVMVTMTLGGFWHGAAWTFVIWGIYHGILLLVQRLIAPTLKSISKRSNLLSGNFKTAVKILFMFHFVCFGWLIFRSQSVDQIYSMVTAILTDFRPSYLFDHRLIVFQMFFLISVLIFVQIAQYVKRDLMVVYNSSVLVKGFFYAICFYLMIVFGVAGGKEFIYFQF